MKDGKKEERKTVGKAESKEGREEDMKGRNWEGRIKGIRKERARKE